MTKEHKNELLKEIKAILKANESSYNIIKIEDCFNGYMVILEYEESTFKTEVCDFGKSFNGLRVEVSAKRAKAFEKVEVYKNNELVGETRKYKEYLNLEELKTALKIINWWYN